MFCCLDNPVQRETSANARVAPILDVGQIVRDYVWKEFTKDFTRCRRMFTSRKRYVLEVPLNYFSVDTVKQKVTERAQSWRGPKGHVVTGQVKDKVDPKDMSAAVELKTDFNNDTDQPQTYKFRLEKTRKSSMTVTIQEGFKIGSKTNFTIGLPKPISSGKISSTLDVMYNITKTSGDLIEESATFETNSDISVGAFSRCEARVVLAESHVSYDFRVWSKISIPAEGVPVAVKSKRNGRVLFTDLITRLDFVFDPYKPHVRIDEVPGRNPSTFTFEVKLLTTGVIQGVRLTDQFITLTSSDLPNRKPKQDGKNPAPLPNGSTSLVLPTVSTDKAVSGTTDLIRLPSPVAMPTTLETNKGETTTVV